MRHPMWESIANPRRPTTAIWTAVIWFSVSVPVLSELIARVEPSVSTERSRFTIAPAAASFCVPARGPP